MRDVNVSHVKSVPPHVYDVDYFLHHRGGSDEFVRTKGWKLYHAHHRALNLARISPRYTVLDIGCGCGEIVFQCSLRCARTVGVDYSTDALRLASEARQHDPPDVKSKYAFLLADVANMPFRTRLFDRIFVLDLVEHLHEDQLAALYAQARMMLKPDGLMVVHTFPNLWHSKFLYPVTGRLRRLIGQERPPDPHTERDKLMHVNEQSYRSLKRALTAAGFRCRLWLEGMGGEDHPGLKSAARRFLCRTYPVSFLFGNDIWAMAWT